MYFNFQPTDCTDSIHTSHTIDPLSVLNRGERAIFWGKDQTLAQNMDSFVQQIMCWGAQSFAFQGNNELSLINLWIVLFVLESYNETDTNTKTDSPMVSLS